MPIGAREEGMDAPVRFDDRMGPINSVSQFGVLGHEIGGASFVLGGGGIPGRLRVDTA
jgi:hypothetical protein